MAPCLSLWAIDVGSTKIAAAVVDETGVIVERLREASPTDRLSLRNAIREDVEEPRSREEVTAVGAGPRICRRRPAVGLLQANFPWRDDPLAACPWP